MATAGVVAVERKLKTRKAKVKMLELTEKAASSLFPSCPTNAVSTKVFTGRVYESLQQTLSASCNSSRYIWVSRDIHKLTARSPDCFTSSSYLYL